MPTPDDFLDSYLSDSRIPGLDSIQLHSTDSETIEHSPFKEPEYEGSIDYRIRQLSYSSLLTLHECPRKFELYKKRSKRDPDSDETSITFAYGHAIGTAIQSIFQNKSVEEVFVEAFINWAPDIFAIDEKANKSLWSAFFSIQKFLALRNAGFLQEYELVYVNGRPACELSFCINFPDGFRLRGFVDAVLRHKITGEIIVLECKTTKSKTISPSTYKNSAQAIGYSIVLDSLFHDLSSYKVIYLINQSMSGDFTAIPFTKNYLQRALWIRELLLDIETIKMYDEAGVYPMRGESCFSFFRDCEYINTCTLSTDHITRPPSAEDEDKTEYQITFTLADLLDTQLRKTSNESESTL